MNEAIKYALCPLSKTDELIDKVVENCWFVFLYNYGSCMKDENILNHENNLDLSPVAVLNFYGMMAILLYNIPVNMIKMKMNKDFFE